MDIHGVPRDGKRFVAYHDHSGPAERARIVGAVRDGQAVAYVSEAGTPLVADPGYQLARAMIAEGLPVTAAPGPSAVLAALTVSGLPSDRFLFAGFAPNSGAARETFLVELARSDATVILYEAPGRVKELLATAVRVMGPERRAVVARELTKKFEEVRRGTLAELVTSVEDRPPKGEIVVLIDRAGDEAAGEEEIDMALRQAMETMRIKDAATAVAGALGLPRRQVYQRALHLTDKA
jgi:16S rRNA (cytidine1402-2'-O)-methyltransferase